MLYAVTFTEADSRRLPELEALSSPWRLERAATIRPVEARLRSLSAGLLLDYALRAEGYPPLKSVSLGPYGQPLTEGFYFSLSHCRGLAVCALSKRPVGVDAEPVRHFSHRLRERVFTAEELASAEAHPHPDAYLTGLWTLKESYLKAKGTGLTQSPASLCFSVASDGSVQGPPGFSYRLYTRPSGYRIALSEAHTAKPAGS
jgi:4'-phosphopantetheinyl transferase